MRLIYTTDFHSAFDPIPRHWLLGSPRLGGAGHIAALAGRERAGAGTSFLVDAGHMSTGTLSLLTKGEALLEMMIALGYDAMGVGSHEFDYGWQNFEEQRARVGVSILCANVRCRRPESERLFRFFQPHPVLERNGVRLGIVSVMGARATKYTIMPSKIDGLGLVDPIAESRCRPTARANLRCGGRSKSRSTSAVQSPNRSVHRGQPSPGPRGLITPTETEASLFHASGDTSSAVAPSISRRWTEWLRGIAANSRSCGAKVPLAHSGHQSGRRRQNGN